MQPVDSVKPVVATTINSAAALAVVDHRPYVIDSDKTPTFEGLMRSGFGIPYSMPTGDNQPLADYFAIIAKSGLSGAGADVSVVKTQYTDSADKVHQTLSRAADDYIYLELVQLKYDNYGLKLNADYDINLNYIDQSRNVRLSKNFAGKEQQQSGGGNLGGIGNAAQQVYKDLVEKMFNDSDFKQAAEQ